MYVVHMYSEKQTAALSVAGVTVYLTKERAVEMFGLHLADHMHFDTPEEYTVVIDTDVYNVFHSFVDEGPYTLATLANRLIDTFDRYPLEQVKETLRACSRETVVSIYTILKVYQQSLATYVYVEKKDV